MARAATLRLPLDAGAEAGASTVVPLHVDDATGFLGTDVVITYDPVVATATGVAKTTLSQDHTLTFNLSPPGEIRISLYGALPLNGGGDLIKISFTAAGTTDCRTDLVLAFVEINEGAIPAFTRDGHFEVRGVPGEVGNLLVSTDGPRSSVAVLTWGADPNAAAFNVYRGERADLADLSCFAAGVTGTTVSDDGAVPAGRLLVFLVTALNCNGESTLGFNSAGVERTNEFPCP
jgi:hypothetical protein